MSAILGCGVGCWSHMARIYVVRCLDRKCALRARARTRSVATGSNVHGLPEYSSTICLGLCCSQARCLATLASVPQKKHVQQQYSDDQGARRKPRKTVSCSGRNSETLAALAKVIKRRPWQQRTLVEARNPMRKCSQRGGQFGGSARLPRACLAQVLGEQKFETGFLAQIQAEGADIGPNPSTGTPSPKLGAGDPAPILGARQPRAPRHAPKVDRSMDLFSCLALRGRRVSKKASVLGNVLVGRCGRLRASTAPNSTVCSLKVDAAGRPKPKLACR